MKAPLSVSLLLLLFAACNTPPNTLLDAAVTDGAVGSDGSVVPADAEPSTDATDDGAVPFTLKKGGSGHSDVAAKLSAGQARAGVITAKGQLLSGIKVEGKLGDFKIYNAKVAFIIQKGRVADGWNPFGGEVVDAMRLGQSGTQGHSLLGETVIGLGVNICKPTSVGVVNDGSDGKASLVRVIGEPALVPYLSGMLGSTFGGELPIRMVIDYVLEPDSQVLQIRHRFFNKTSVKRDLPFQIVALAAGDGPEFFSEVYGFNFKNYLKKDYVGMVGPHISYALVSLDYKLLPLVPYSGVWVMSSDILTLPAAGEAQKTYYLVVAEGSAEAVRKAVRKLKKEAEPTALSGSVLDPAKKGVAGVRVHVQKDDTDTSYVTMARSDAQGKYQVALGSGSYLVTVVAEGRAQTDAVKVKVGSSAVSQDLTVGATGTIKYTVKEKKSGKALPAKLVFLPAKAPKGYSKAFGEKTHPHGSALVVYSTTGSGDAALPPGSYTVHISRGYEYEISSTKVTLAAGETSSVSVTLERTVDTTGYMSGDFHLHSMYSPDSSDLYEFKVATIVAHGVELPVTTDHEYIADYSPYIAKLGMQSWAHGIIGEELTTLTYGHFNLFPITQDASKANQGAILWHQKSPGQLFADVYKTWPNTVLQVNHPRSASIGGYFTYVGYNEKTGKADKIPAEWSMNFDAFEVFNSKSFKGITGEMADWVSFLDRGFLVTGTGNSDSHNAYHSQVGWPRNYVKLSTDEPNKLNLAEFTKAVKDQKVLISGGPFINATVGGKSFGEVADATDASGKVKVKIKVQAPTWMKADTLLVYTSGGVQQHKVTLDSTTADKTNPVIRYNDSLELTMGKKDSYVIVVVTGSGSLAPVTNGSPFAVTNPIYLDVDGNKAYDSPLSF